MTSTPSTPSPHATSSRPSSPSPHAADHADGIVSLRGIHKAFGTQQVLSGVDIEFQEGQTTVIIGLSGTGKSVCLKHIVGLLRPDAGEVWFHGRRVDHLPERSLAKLRTQFGYLFQLGALFDSMTVEDNICFPLVEHGHMSRNDRQDRCRDVLGLVGMDGTQHQMPVELSGGQRKRVALARAIALNPRVILYDEPTTGLDPIRSDTINDLILKLQSELNVTSIVVTHDMSSAYKIGDRIVMLHDGRFIADGKPDDIRNSDHPFVQRFVRGEATDESEFDALMRMEPIG